MKKSPRINYDSGNSGSLSENVINGFSEMSSTKIFLNPCLNKYSASYAFPAPGIN
ncbi:hypothetical protein [Aquimarina sp. BL5]|uniref:hypothetical protein n=1 Tax=Aquimarina sp. BL5 TaxID=1714860 RepID=UPI0013149883